MSKSLSQPRAPSRLEETNRRFYDALWADARLIEAPRFNTWPLVQSLLGQTRRRLEVGPGLRLHLPIENTQYADISLPALRRLRRHGAAAVQGNIGALPFADHTFDLVCALDIVEHVGDDNSAVRELCRVTRPDGIVLLAVPLYATRWSGFDEIAGHCRRYEPDQLAALLADAGLDVVQSAAYGMQPRSSYLVNLGTWFMQHRREQSMWWYNRVFMPLALRFQSKLALQPGWIDTTAVDEILLVCRKTGAR